jgi:hypothetical protein
MPQALMLWSLSRSDRATVDGRVSNSAVACESPKIATVTGVARRVGVGVGDAGGGACVAKPDGAAVDGPEAAGVSAVPQPVNTSVSAMATRRIRTR